MTRQEIFEQIKQKNTYLCVGLDTDIQKIPKHLLACEDPIFEFNKQIIDATADFCVAYKINTAFYESLGWKGWQSLEKTFDYIPKSIFTIADAKRGDIGNTSSLYARAFFEQMQADSLTVAPYMGEDSVKPFLEYKDKWVILLALTSNSGSADFQWFKSENNQFLFEKVIETSLTWANADQMMYVLGATRIDYFKKIRQLIPEHFLLVPGYGAQGGDLRLVSELGLNNKCGLLVNSSRAIIYADDGKDFANQAQKIAKEIGQEMKIYLQEFC